MRRPLDEAEARFDLERGPNDLGDLVLSLAPLKVVSGRILVPDGPFQGACALLTDEQGRSLVRQAWESEGDPSTGGFEFDTVAPGSWRLSILGLDGRTYTPGAIDVTPPAQGLVFVASATREPLDLHVQGAREARAAGRPSASPRDGMATLARVQGRWLVMGATHSFPRTAVERWIVLTDGHRPVSGTTPGSSSLEVSPEPGWGHAWLFLSAGSEGGVSYMHGDAQALEGVSVLLDGRPVARSDGSGLALLALGTPPVAPVTFSLDGWRVVDRNDGHHWSEVLLERE